MYFFGIYINFCVCVLFKWAPDGKRVITGNRMGHFTLWNGNKFSFETVIQVTHLMKKEIIKVFLSPMKEKKKINQKGDHYFLT